MSKFFKLFLPLNINDNASAFVVSVGFLLTLTSSLAAENRVFESRRAKKGVDVPIFGVAENQSVEAVSSVASNVFTHNEERINIFVKVYGDSKPTALARPLWGKSEPRLEINFFSRRK